MRTSTFLLALCLPAIAWAQPAPRLTPLATPPHGRLAALAALERPFRALVGLVDSQMLSSTDRGRSWQTVAQLDELEEGALVSMTSDGETIAAVASGAVWWSRDGARTFIRAQLPAGEVRGVALTDGGRTLLAATGDGIARFVLDEHQAILERFTTVEDDLQHVAARAARVVVATGQQLFLSRDGGRTFAPGPAAPSRVGEILALTIDGGGEVWIATASGLMILADDGRFRPVGAPLIAAGEVELLSGPQGELLLLAGGEIQELRAQPRRVEALSAVLPSEVRRSHRRRRRPIQGLLPSIALDATVGPERRAISIRLVWPLPSASRSEVTRARRLELEEIELVEESRRRRSDAWMRWASGRALLGQRCPGESDEETLEEAVAVIRARAEIALEELGPP